MCKATWIDQNLPSMTGAIFTKKRRYNVSAWEPPSGMCKDVRLLKDPTIPVVRENVADPGPSDKPETASAVQVESLARCPVEMAGHSAVSPPVPRSFPAETVSKAPDVEMVPTDSGTSAEGHSRHSSRDRLVRDSSRSKDHKHRGQSRDHQSDKGRKDRGRTSAGGHSKDVSRDRLARVPSQERRSTTFTVQSSHRIPTMVFTATGSHSESSRPQEKQRAETSVGPASGKSKHQRRTVEMDEEIITVQVAAKKPSTVLAGKSSCPFPTCNSSDKKVRRHVYQAHLPFVFTERISTPEVIGKRMESLRSLIHASVGLDATYQDAVDYLNTAQLIPPEVELNVEHQDDIHKLCETEGWKNPGRFSLHPVNSPALLVHWRCLVALLLELPAEKQREWCLDGRIASRPPSSTGRDETPDVTEGGLGEAQGPRVESSDDELEEMIVLDQCSENSASDVNNNDDDETPSAFDSHFHLDRTAYKLWGRHTSTVDELLRSSVRTGHPNLRILLVGGGAVYSEPNTYPKSSTLKGNMKLAMGVHPKHVEELTTERFLTLQQMVRTPEVAAIGEIGLDRTVPARREDVVRVWRKQDEVFRKVLGLSRPEQPVILHLRGPIGDRIGADVHARALQILRKVCPSRQMIHLHCFTGDSEMVQEWSAQYPNTNLNV